MLLTDHSQGRPKGPLFDSYYTKCVGEGVVPYLAPLTLEVPFFESFV